MFLLIKYDLSIQLLYMAVIFIMKYYSELTDLLSRTCFLFLSMFRFTITFITLMQAMVCE
ncbi:hypothetical protein A3466_17785 [Enterobacter genomosp. S]|uniref:Uncharacterized protein n=1 Tax=Enterobacter genomosp. S TaxID=2364151 RepID=A0ABR5YRL6_9ENTR|nr:hypothetical protein A3466_17785 [Enterobacter genomosp. S]